MSKKLKIDGKKKRERLHIFKSADEIISSSGLFGAHIEILNNSQIMIEGCMGVYEYRDTYLKLKLNKGALIITGNGFDIANYEDKTITVKGKISSLEFGL